ncbi:MAG: hypothetical protein QOH05_2429, partial [Acetobacteraceae bacterium]|nr:hypothetical protein [Acetobacteraceae bacterium]
DPGLDPPRCLDRPSNRLTGMISIDNHGRMITCRYKHAKAKKSLIKGTEDLRTL